MNSNFAPTPNAQTVHLDLETLINQVIPYWVYHSTSSKHEDQDCPELYPLNRIKQQLKFGTKNAILDNGAKNVLDTTKNIVYS